MMTETRPSQAPAARASVDIRRYPRMLRRRWIPAVATFLTVVVSTLVFAGGRTRTFETSTRLFVGQQAITRPDLPAANELTIASLALVKSYSEAIRSRPIAEEVVTKLHLAQRPDDVLGRLRAEQVGETQIIRITFSDRDARTAQLVANAFADTFIGAIGRIDPRPEDLGVKVTVVEPAAFPALPAGPSSSAVLAAGMLAALVVAAASVLIAERLDPAVPDARTAERISGLPVLGRVPLMEAPPGTLARASGPSGESFRLIRTALRYKGLERSIVVVGVTSAEPGEGKTTVALNLATAFADTDAATVLVEADMRRPVLSYELRLAAGTGLAGYLAGAADRCVLRTPHERLFVVPSGGTPTNPSELLASERMDELAARLRGEADVVVVDTPPVLAVSDAAAVSRVLDAVIVVVRSGRTRADALREAVRTLQDVGAPMLGIVLVGGSPPTSYGYV